MITPADQTALRDALGETHGELLQRIIQAASDGSVAIDQARADARQSKAAADKAAKHASKLAGDLEARGTSESETIAALQAKVDKASQEASQSTTALAGAQKRHALFGAVLDRVGGDATRAGDVVALYAAEHGLDGLTLSGSTLEGHMQHLEAMQQSRAYMFQQQQQQAPGNGGGAAGADRNQTGGRRAAQQLTPGQQAAQQGAELADAFLSRQNDPLASLYTPRNIEGQQQAQRQPGVVALPGNAASL